MRLGLLLLSLLACGENEEAPVPPEPVDEFVPTAVPAPLPEVPSITAVGGEGAADVELRFHGVGDLHKGFLSDPALVGKLAKALGPCMADTAQVIIRWNAEERVGWIQLKVPPGGVACMPVPHPEGGWDTRPLAPVGEALAAYRDGAAANYDFRFASFAVGMSFTRGSNQCLLRISGQHPPDGSQFSPCVDIAGVPSCVGGGEEDGVSHLAHTGSAGATISSCFAN
ncbi:MAG: hypothetical protein KC912_17160 [Proteobacteria bacterium]|nr:hypothetical protein [Pseudomonadota bacterium]